MNHWQEKAWLTKQWILKEYTCLVVPTANQLVNLYEHIPNLKLVFSTVWVFIIQFMGSLWSKKMPPLAFFGTLAWKKHIVFKTVNMPINRMKTTFLYNLRSWANLYILKRLRSLVDFLTCLGCKQWWWACLRKIGFCIHFPFIYLPFGTPFVYFLYTLGCPRAFLVVNIFLAFTHKKIIQFMELIQPK